MICIRWIFLVSSSYRKNLSFRDQYRRGLWPGRTAFSIYRLDDRDQAALWWLGALGGYILSMWGAGGFACRYFPTFRLAPRDGWSLSGLLAFGLLCLTPVIINRREDRQWTRLRSMT